ncbi:hypothetical protein ACOSQ4_031195 [Xanthoceras sorbifolium]
MVCSPSPHVPPSIREVFCWILPPFGALKLNFDVAIREDLPFVGIGAAVRDHCGHILAVVFLCLSGSFLAEVGEALTLREGLLLAKNLGIGVRFVECDYVNVVNDVSFSAFGMGVAGCVLNDIRALCKDVGVVSCQAISRKRNDLAHTLAALACFSRKDRFWFDVKPCCFSPLR